MLHGGHACIVTVAQTLHSKRRPDEDGPIILGLAHRKSPK
jgi:hypothetical protein